VVFIILGLFILVVGANLYITRVIEGIAIPLVVITFLCGIATLVCGVLLTLGRYDKKRNKVER
jgi:uncharacterized membrane protein YhaH (DUF805 family)